MLFLIFLDATSLIDLRIRKKKDYDDVYNNESELSENVELYTREQKSQDTHWKVP